jgi:ABC-type transport system substrate-binding protein
LAEAGQAGGFEVRVNPVVFTYALDGPDVMEAVALDWEKIGIKVKRAPEASSSFGPKGRLRKTNKTFSVYGSPPYDEPVAGWERVIHSRGAFNLLLDGTYDEEIDTIVREIDADKRATLTHDLGQKLYDGYHGVMLGMKSVTWALGRKVSGWQTLAYVPAETNYESVR